MMKPGVFLTIQMRPKRSRRVASTESSNLKVFVENYNSQGRRGLVVMSYSLFILTTNH
jgi:hypothetical protein